MDEVVKRAMQRWPNVPAVYGWLTLDRRGDWLIKTTEERFERVTNPTMRAFFGRNYMGDEHGRWYVQNGPQRVFVALEYTPWVYGLGPSASSIATHTDILPAELRRLFLDDFDHLLLETEHGIGVLSDRDLPNLLDRMVPADESHIDTTLLAVAEGQDATVRLFEHTLPITLIHRADVPARFGFIARPAPPTGQPDC